MKFIWGKEWDEAAIMQPVPGLPGHCVETITTKTNRDHHEFLYKDVTFDGYVVYECVSEVHMASGVHVQEDCKWRPLLDANGQPWWFMSVGQVNTCLAEIAERRIGSNADNL